MQPDGMVVLKENRRIIRERIEGPPDLVVEVVSPGTAERDRKAKRGLYARHGVREYRIVDPERRTIGVNVWTPSGYEVAHDFAYADAVVSPYSRTFPFPHGRSLIKGGPGGGAFQRELSASVEEIMVS